MEAMLGISLYSKNTMSFLLLLMFFSSTKLEKRAEQVLPGSKGVEGEREGLGGRGREMAQTMYAHVNK
jgi:hypothetical protein